MRILVINGSPKCDKSDTLRLSRAFLGGMNASAEFVNVYEVDIHSCTGCLSCWFKTQGKCVLHDDAQNIFEKIVSCNLVIWSMPLYTYGAPSQCKALMDRMISLVNPHITTDHDGHYLHASKKNPQNTMLISGCGYPEVEWNFDGLRFQFQRIYGDIPMILCPEAPLLGLENAKKYTEPYLAKVRDAGAEYAMKSCLSPATLDSLAIPMMPPSLYRRLY